MSTLEYLDSKGKVAFYRLVPNNILHSWLSELNGVPSCKGVLAKNVNRGKVLEELERRRKGQESKGNNGHDWRSYENGEGYTHLEELLIYQPKAWRDQAREYIYLYNYDVNRKSQFMRIATIEGREIRLKSPILAVLFHESIKRTSRYDALNFLVSYGAEDPLPALMKNMKNEERASFLAHVSPMDYFIDFEKYVAGYDITKLRSIGFASNCTRLHLMKELDFCGIVGQRLAKHMIRQAVVNHVMNQTAQGEFCSANPQPLSLIFAGPSGIGKTELSRFLSQLLNEPSQRTSYFHKVDCGKLTDENEIFGMAGAYRGSEDGSALNNFVVRMSQEPNAVGIVLMDEIEKAKRGVIHALYQVLDKGEWCNKRSTKGSQQTDTICCRNLIFIMTTNSCDRLIQDYALSKPDIYTAEANDLNDIRNDLENKTRIALRQKYPFTDAFIGRVKRVVPFIPIANGDPDKDHPLLCETTTIAKVLIEREQEKYEGKSSSFDVRQLVSAKMKHRMAKIIRRDIIPETGVRSIEQLVKAKMSEELMDSILLTKGGIPCGSKVKYVANEKTKLIDFQRVEGEYDLADDATVATDNRGYSNNEEDYSLDGTESVDEVQDEATKEEPVGFFGLFGSSCKNDEKKKERKPPALQPEMEAISAPPQAIISESNDSSPVVTSTNVLSSTATTATSKQSRTANFKKTSDDSSTTSSIHAQSNREIAVAIEKCIALMMTLISLILGVLVKVVMKVIQIAQKQFHARNARRERKRK